jgi:hypothetical protein
MLSLLLRCEPIKSEGKSRLGFFRLSGAAAADVFSLEAKFLVLDQFNALVSATQQEASPRESDPIIPMPFDCSLMQDPRFYFEGRKLSNAMTLSGFTS